MTASAQPLTPCVVIVPVPPGREDELTNLCRPINDIEGRRRATALRRQFNLSVLETLKTFAATQGLQSEVDFTQAGANVMGVAFSCSAVFETAAVAAKLPNVGRFLRDQPVSPRQP